MSQPISGEILTLTLANKAYNLLALMQAKQITENTPVSDGNCSELCVYNNNATGGAVVYIGGANLNSGTTNGLPLAATAVDGGMGASYRFGPYPYNGFPIANVWLQGSVDGATVQVLVSLT